MNKTNQQMSYLGKHTAIAHVTPEIWSQIPYLKDNNGALPPFVLAVGDARRLQIACETLPLKNIVSLHSEVEKLVGLKGRGRVDLILATYEHEHKSVPLLLVETQMGMPATEINLREVLAHCSQEYQIGDQKLKTNGLFIIRAGTAGGINTIDDTQPKLVVGDLINAQFSIGWSGALIESLAGLNFASPEVLFNFQKNWKKAGHSFTNDNKYPLGKSSDSVVTAISGSAKELNLRCFEGGNFSKDSLYAEMNDEAFIKLRKRYNVMSTEMEQIIVCKLMSDFALHNIILKTGMVSGVIGTIPGASFAKEYDEVEKNVLRVAARALWKLGTQGDS